MIGYLRGDVAEITEATLIIDVSGVGYKVTVPTSVSAALRPGDRDVKIHTSMFVTDGDMSLYGFMTGAERDIFETLTTVSGIGPKGAVKLLSLPREQLVEAIQAGDVAVLTRVPGIGKKTAERICLELRDKLSKDFGPSAGLPAAVFAAAGEIGVAMSGLQSLGFSPSEVRAMLKAILEEEYKSLGAQEIIKLCLKRRK